VDDKLFGVDLFGEPIRQRVNGPLAERFQFPPFSVLDARAGEWQERKQAWLSLGIDGEINPLGREEGLTHNTASWFADKGKTGGDNTTSIFDPVLTEMAYRWFSHEGAQVVDPFADGSVRGIVSALTGRKYWGCDLRAEQIEANEEQRAKICPDSPIEWVVGDAMDKISDAPPADFIFACPPYGDLEVYSDDPADLSTMEYNTFIPALGRIILRCAERLKNDRAACFVVGDFRDKRTGMLRGFPGDVVQLFRNAGMNLYNEAILVTPCGSLPVRVGRQFDAAKKLGKTHQNVLVFVKGDARKAFSSIK
jgi:DNA modification methylase